MSLSMFYLVTVDLNQDSSPVAQSVEQVTVNHWVGGSNPSGGAKNREAYK